MDVEQPRGGRGEDRSGRDSRVGRRAWVAVRASASLAVILAASAEPVAAQVHLEIENPVAPLSILLAAGSTLRITLEDGGNVDIGVDGTIAVRTTCRLDAFGECVVVAPPPGSIAAVDFVNSSPRTVVLASGADVVVEQPGPSVLTFANVRAITASCALAPGGGCIGLPSAGAAPPPSVSLSASGFTAPASGPSLYPAGTAFTLSWSVTHADYCELAMGGGSPLVPSWSGTVFGPPVPRGVTLAFPASTYQFLIRCVGAGGDASTAFVVQTTAENAPSCSTPAGFTRQLTPGTYEQLFGGSFPSVDGGSVSLPTTQYSAIAFFVPPANGTSGRFVASTLPGRPQPTLTLSGCPGYFAAAGLASDCHKVGSGRALVWRIGSGGNGHCGLVPGQTYYLNIAFVDAAGAATCATPPCTAFVAQSDTVITQPIPLLAPGADDAPAVGGVTRFGAATAVSGDVLVVGLPEADQGAGRVFVYRRAGAPGTWAFEAELQAQGKAIGDKFGGSLSISDDGRSILVGVPLDDHGGGLDRGSVRLFQTAETTWSDPYQETVLIASDAADGDRYGSAVSIAPGGEAYLIGAPFKDAETGSAYFAKFPFAKRSRRADGAIETKPLPAIAKAGLAIGDKFGSSVATDSDAAGGRWVIGAPGRDVGRGVVRSLRDVGGSFVLNAEIAAPSGAAGDGFGSAVALAGDTLIAGAPGDDVDPEGVDDGDAGDDDADRGSVHLVEYDGDDVPSTPLPLVPPVGAAGDRLGAAVVIRGDTVLASSPDADAVDDIGVFRANRGTVAVFRRCRTLPCAAPSAKAVGDWRFDQTLIGRDAEAGEGFGSALGFAGEAIVVGAPERAGGTGALHAFRRSREPLFSDGFEP